MSSFNISKLENLLFQELNKQVSQIPPFALNKELYQAGCNHAKQVLSKKIKNVKLGSKERKSLFPKAIRYKEICFVSAPISSINSDPETSKSLCSMILNHYSSDLKSGLNSIGPVLVPLKSKKILVIILFAFFQPYIPASKFRETFEPLSKQKIAPDDKSNFVKLINTFRSLAHFDELNMTKPKSKLPFCVAKYNYDCACSYSIQLFQRLMSYCNLYDLLIDYWTNFSIEVTPDSKDESCFKLTLTFWRFNSYVEYNVDVISLLQKEHKPEEITSKQQEPVIEVPATSYYEDTTQDRVFQPIESTSYNPDLETKVALDDLYSNSQQNIKSEPPVPETPAEKFVSYDECKETTPSQETKIAIEEDLIRNQDIPPSNDTFNLDDIHTRGVVINLDETITKEEAKEEAMILKEENEIEDLKNETEIVKGEIAHEAQLLKNAIDKEVSGDKDEQKAARYAEEAAKAEKISADFANKENEAHQNAEEARYLQAKLEEDASNEAKKAEDAKNALNEANQQILEAEQKEKDAKEAAEKLEKDLEIQDQIYQQSEQIIKDAREKEADADKQEQKTLDAARILQMENANQTEIANIQDDINDVLAALDEHDSNEQKVQNLMNYADNLEKAAKTQEEVIERATKVANEALQAEEQLTNEIEKQNEIQKEQQIIKETSSAKIPELSKEAEKSLEQAELFKAGAEAEDEVAKEAEKAEKKARKDRHSFNLVAAALRRSSERFEAMAEAAGQVEEVLEGEYNNSLDFGEEDIIEKPQRDKENEDEIEMINNLDDYIENDKITDNEKHSVLDFIAANEDEFAKGDRFDAYSSEALEMLKAEKANDTFDNTLIEEEEEDTNGDNSEQQSIPDFQYDEKYEARSSEVNPVPEVESAKETELSTDFEYSNEIETEAAKQLGETV